MKNTVIFFAIYLLASFPAQAADTVELKVSGVIRPVACSLSLDRGGIVDYGTIDATQIPANQATLLETKTLSFAVTCGAPIPIALRLIDNQASTVVPGLAGQLSPAVPDLQAYGLGSVNGTNIGVYAVQVERGSVRGVGGGGVVDPRVNVLSSIGSVNSWISDVWTSTKFHADGDNDWKAFSRAAMSIPEAFTSLAGNLSVTAVLDKGANLPLGQEIHLNGSATLEVMYL